MKAHESGRVGVVGASGIGKHHAKWWALEGADVCGFVGTSPQSVAETRQNLHELFGFSGRGYTSIEALINAERPDIVDICSPPALHVSHAEAVIEAGCDVLCEKPFYYDPERGPDEILNEARRIVALARDKSIVLGMCAQYAVAADYFVDIWRRERGNETITRYDGLLQTPARGRSQDPGRVWVDLSPHLLSVIQRIAPGTNVDWLTLEVEFRGLKAKASFSVRRRGGPALECNLTAVNTTEEPTHVRRFAFNDFTFTIEGRVDGKGVYGARIETPAGAFEEDDMMRVLIRKMLAGTPVVSGGDALVNLERLLQILDFARDK